jgi:hypothetical protein
MFVTIYHTTWNHIAEDTKFTFYKVKAVPTLLYVSKTWTKKNKNVRKFQVAEIEFLRNIKSYTTLDKIKSENICIRKQFNIY